MNGLVGNGNDRQLRWQSWRMAFRKTIRLLPGLVLIALVPAAVSGPSRWNASELLAAATVGVGCAPVVLVMFVAANWLAMHSAKRDARRSERPRGGAA